MATQNLCSRCASLGKTCCQETEIYLTVGDIKRIAEFAARLDFYEYRAPADPSYLDQEDDPVWATQTMRPDKTRRVLKHQAEQNCLFLTPTGCQLPMTVRPLVCRIHPFTYTNTGIGVELDDRCQRARPEPGLDLVAALGMSLAQAQAWHRQLYEEIFILEGVESNEDRHRLRPAV